jgi:arylsulfatase A-like enzyme
MDILEGGIRVPLAVQWTRRLPGRVVHGDPVSSLDFVATANSLAPADKQRTMVCPSAHFLGMWTDGRESQEI